MKGLAVALLVATSLAGCTVDDVGDAEGEFLVEILFDDRNVYYAGDEVELAAAVTEGAGDVTFVWDMGDGTVLEGIDIVHMYAASGLYDVRLTGQRDDGGSATAALLLTIEAVFWGLEPAPTGDGSGIVQVVVVGDEPTQGGAVRLGLTGPAALSDAGAWTVWAGDEAHWVNVTGLPATMDLPMPDAGRQELLWAATIGGTDYVGTVAFDVWGLPIQFGEPTAAQWLRPGVHSEVCTVNFLFHYKWYRFFIGSAAHCIDSGEACAGTGAIGSRETLSAHNSGTKTQNAWVAYNSWLSMDAHGGGDCSGNDFALIELGREAQAVMHPKALFFGGPTEMAPIAGYARGTVLHGYGASNLHGNLGVAYPGQPEVNSKRGVALGVENGGYSQHLYFLIPGVPGDSGGPAFGPGGEALGAASTITVTPTTGSNRYTVIPKALEYMESVEGWAPELVTYADWSATGT